MFGDERSRIFGEYIEVRWNVASSMPIFFAEISQQPGT